MTTHSDRKHDKAGSETPIADMQDVFDSKQESEALVVKGLLESAGIECAIISLDAPQDVLPGVGGIVIRVVPEQAAEARRVIAAAQKPDNSASQNIGSDNPRPQLVRRPKGDSKA